MTSGYLFDTNHLGKAVTAGSVVRRRIAELRASGVKLGTCVPVLCEIEAGIQQVNQPDAYRLNLERLLRQVRIWPVDRLTARIYGVIHHDLKRRGRVLSQVDMMLAALARQRKLTLVTSDQDFAALPDVPTENWLSESGTSG
ncbi:MAG: type II toxin-antitoxin system VapC family toxin [Tepidisphaeraceae bacterium]